MPKKVVKCPNSRALCSVCGHVAQPGGGRQEPHQGHRRPDHGGEQAARLRVPPAAWGRGALLPLSVWLSISVCLAVCLCLLSVSCLFGFPFISDCLTLSCPSLFTKNFPIHFNLEVQKFSPRVLYINFAISFNKWTVCVWSTIITECARLAEAVVVSVNYVNVLTMATT